ncbi:hypothetical protein [Polaribacter sp.]|uniref:hypothetical protein n=1 Tax=Polaribacter sp. TaxID=1920175 RepID=UPI003F6C6004
MYYNKKSLLFKQRLQSQYLKLIELSDNYRYLDESLSDMAAYNAMKLLQKLNKLSYLEREPIA